MPALVADAPGVDEPLFDTPRASDPDINSMRRRLDVSPASSPESLEVRKKLAGLRRPVLCDLQDKVAGLALWGSNWEDYEGEPPAEDTIRLAISWLTALFEDAYDSYQPWVDPHMTASEDGEIVFEWWRDDRKLTVYFLAPEIESTMRWGTPPSLFREETSVQSSQDRRRVWAWLMG